MSHEAHEAATPATLGGVAICTMFRGDPVQLLEWCNFHLNAGADRLYVVLDCPAAELVSALPEHPRVEWQVVDQATWDTFYPRGNDNVERKQVDTFRWIARRAVADGHDHLAFIDADEFIALSEPFADLSRRFPDASSITLPVKEMWYASADPTNEPFGATVAVGRSSPLSRSWYDAIGWRAQFLHNGMLGHDTGKTVYRLPLTAGDITVHFPMTGSLAAQAATCAVHSGAVLHFDSGSVATWNAKWAARLEGDTLVRGLRSHRLAQQSLFAHILRQPAEDQAEFFTRFYSLDPTVQSRLEAASIVERVDVHDMIVGPLPIPAGPPVDQTLRRLPLSSARVDYQFAMVCDRRFVKPTFATMTSVLSKVGHKGSVRFVVLGDGLEPADAVWLRSLEYTGYDVEVAVHDITADLDRDVGTEDTKRATFGRIYLIDYLPPQRTVYLDGDVLATRDFTELFDLDLEGACLAGVTDSAALRLVAEPAGVPILQRNRLLGITDGDPLEYLNGGVLVFDLDNPDFRELALQARALVVMRGPALEQRDQDAMNIAFAGRKHKLPSTYNYMTQFYVSDRCLDGDLIQRKYSAADASLIHFSGRIKPWESPEDEFYNGLYRRMVLEAEAQVGVSCDFYFSGPSPTPPHTWSAARWREVLEAAPAPAWAEREVDIEVLDVTDSAVYLKQSAESYQMAMANDLRLAMLIDGATVAEVPLRHAGSVETHLTRRVSTAVRRIPLDLSRTLGSRGGVARNIEWVVTRSDEQGVVDFARSVGRARIVAASSVADSDLLPETGADGGIEQVSDGWLQGWYRPISKAWEEPITLSIGGEMVATKTPGPKREDLDPAGRIRGFKFNLGNLRRIGYPTGTEVSVRIAGTNIPLRGGPLSVPDPWIPRRYDVGRGSWVETPVRTTAVGVSKVRRNGRAVLRRVRHRLRHRHGS